MNILSVPMFLTALGLTRLLAGALERIGSASLRPLLLVELLLLVGFLALCASAGASLDLHAPRAVVAGMLGVSAMAVQNALVQISLREVPSTAVMTTNITRFMIDIGDVVFGRKLSDAARARERAMLTWPAIVSFAIGCGLGAAYETAIGLMSLALPAGLAALCYGEERRARGRGGPMSRDRGPCGFDLDRSGGRIVGRAATCAG